MNSKWPIGKLFFNKIDVISYAYQDEDWHNSPPYGIKIEHE
jgi:hypothetical protein